MEIGARGFAFRTLLLHCSFSQVKSWPLSPQCAIGEPSSSNNSPFPICPISIPDHVTKALENQRIIDRSAVNDDWLLRLFRQLVAARANNELRTPLQIGLTKA
jgi:hypothetical protein